MGKSQARNPTHKQKAERFRAQYQHLGAAAGPSHERPSCIRGVPGVRNAPGVLVGGVFSKFWCFSQFDGAISKTWLPLV